MALTGLQIFKLMPKTNCKECGHPTCLAFSMALANAKIALEACPYVTDEAKEALGAAAAPPVAKIVIGKGDKAREMGDETVLFRHDKQFFHPSCIAITITDDLDDAAFGDRLSQINDLVFERVGMTVSIDGIALFYKSGDPARFAARAAEVASKGVFAPILAADSAEAMAMAVEACAGERPLIYGANEENWEAFAGLAKKHSCPLCVQAPDLDRLEALADKAAAVTKELVVGTTAEGTAQKLADLTQIRRQAIRKKVRGLGYPSVVSVCGKEPVAQVAEASVYIAKYGSLIFMDTVEKADILPLCALRQNLFSDPQKPAQVEPGIYPVGEADKDSPVYCTTNFSLTYYTVEGEISGSRIPSWIIATPTDGTSVLTAWAAGKYTADKIAEFMEEIDINNKISHRNIVIPGYVAVLKAPLEEKSGWKVMVGPNEAAGLPAFAKSNFA
jgi:acetyl-CoA decarbonylase/synthase complex subunit gamma